jgi:hypothetical protein
MFDRRAFCPRKIGDGASAGAIGLGSLSSPPNSVRENSADDKVHAVEMDLISEGTAKLLQNPSFHENSSLSGDQKPSRPSRLSQAPNCSREASAQRIPANGSDDSIRLPSSGAGPSMVLDPQSEAVGQITVKIGNLGNGEHSFSSVVPTFVY